MRKLTVYLAGAVAVGLLFFALCPVALAWPTHAWRNRISLLAGALWSRFCLWMAGIRLVCDRGREHLATRPAVFTFNHTNFIDFFVNGLLASPGWLVFGKRELARVPAVGWGWRLGGHPLIQREDREQWQAEMDAVVRRLRSGRACAIIAPEGHRSIQGAVQPFKKGALHLALQSGAPIVPIVIKGGSQLLVRGEPMPGTITVSVLPPISTAGWREDELERRAEDLRALYVRELSTPAPQPT